MRHATESSCRATLLPTRLVGWLKKNFLMLAESHLASPAGAHFECEIFRGIEVQALHPHKTNCTYKNYVNWQVQINRFSTLEWNFIDKQTNPGDHRGPEYENAARSVLTCTELVLSGSTHGIP
ncbi:hypothetical protein J6590_029195 [Homalodisca vitripennis]|nr:hypothetical protein J6590_029195 [Homalodisca vitripennis]